MSIFNIISNLKSNTTAPAPVAPDWGWQVDDAGAILGKGAPLGAFVGSLMGPDGRKIYACSLGRDREVWEATSATQAHVSKKVAVAAKEFHSLTKAHELASKQAHEIGQTRKGLESAKSMVTEFRSQVSQLENGILTMAKSSHEDLTAIEELLSDW